MEYIVCSSLPFLLEGLTPDQKHAIANLWRMEQRKKFFTGISIPLCIEDFRRINILKTTDPETARIGEEALFRLCHFEP